MSRLAYIAEIEAAEIPNLSYIAGLLVGQGVPQAAVLQNLMERIQVVEVDDEFGETNVSGDVDDTDAESNVVELRPGGELDPIDPTTDPTSPEALGIQLNQPAPPPPPGPQNHPSDFGAGPPPREG